MNAVEIEEAVSRLAEQPFDAQEFPFAFLEAFGNKATTIKRLRSGQSNKSDLGGVLQTNNIHILTCPEGEVSHAMAALRGSPATAKAKAKFILATDGNMLEADELDSNEAPIVCEYQDFPDHFGFFLPLAGISTVRQIKESSFDIKATGRLNRLYVELLKDNKDWDTEKHRPDMNHFMARLIFCFFAEDTDIFQEENLFTGTVERMSDRDASNTHEIISEIFRAMDCKRADREKAGIPRYANQFPYVNGALFSGNIAVPKFSKIARSYLLNIGRLDWKKINPDIFGSMIQAVADDDERGALGMHYTSVPNILKVLNPLFLDDLREKLEDAGKNSRKLLNLRNRMAKIRVFDPACGSGNFLVIAYKEMRAIEHEINLRRGDLDRRTCVPITNFRGIELRDFSAEIARLALIIAEYQCDVLYRGQKEALAEFLPLNAENWITCGNALRLDWESLCPPTGISVKYRGDDLFDATFDQSEIDFQNEGGETYICGNPPYRGSKWQSKEQKSDLKNIFDRVIPGWKSLDYVSGWLLKAIQYGNRTETGIAFVTTNSICQGLQVPILWPEILSNGYNVSFAYTSFTWKNLASNHAGVTVVIVGLSKNASKYKQLFSIDERGETTVRACTNINPYLVAAPNVLVAQRRSPISEASQMLFGNMPRDGGNFSLTDAERRKILTKYPELDSYILRYLGSEELTKGKIRWCFWLQDADSCLLQKHPVLRTITSAVAEFRRLSKAESTRDFAKRPHRFVQIAGTAKTHTIAVSKVSTERREYLPVDLYDQRCIVSDLLFAIYDGPLWNFSLIASKLHKAWISSVCGKMRVHHRYSNTLGWNTFPVPELTTKNKLDLEHTCMEILLAREEHYPLSISELYDPESMPQNLRDAHDRNDEVIERIYIGRRFKNDTERLEKLFELYTKLITAGDSK